MRPIDNRVTRLLGAAIEAESVERLFAETIERSASIAFDPATGGVTAELARAIPRPDTGHQAELGGIGQLDGMVFVPEGHGTQHGAEHFLLGQAVLHRNIPQQGGRLVEAGFGRLGGDLSLGHHGDASHLRIAEETLDALLLALADQRPEVEVHGCRPHTQGCERVAQALQQGLVDLLVDQQP